MKKLDKRLFRMIKTTKGQYIAVLAIIVTGIFVFTAVSNSAINLKDSINDYYSKTNFADIFVQGRGFTEKLEKELTGNNDIKQVELRLVFDTKYITDNEDDNVDIRVVSVDKNENKINELFMKSGNRSLSERDAIVIEQFAVARKIKLGDELNIKINGKKQSFRVSGIASSSEYIYMLKDAQTMLPDPENFGVVFIEEDTLRKIYGSRGNFNEILISLNSEENIEKTADYLENRLDDYSVRVTKKQDQLSNNMLSQEITGLEVSSKSVPVVFLIFAGIMLATMLSRIVKKDRMSIGVLKAMGFTNEEIVVHYLKYAASVGIIGGLLGSIIGTALSGLMTNYYLVFFNIPMLTLKVYYYRIVVSVILSLLFCIASGFWGVRGVMKINPAESMKPEAPKKGKRILIENIKLLWEHVSFSWKLVLRNIFREKKKFVFIGAAVAITCGMMTMTTWMLNIIDVMFNRQFTEFQKVQYNVSFSKFMDDSVINEFANHISIEEMEGRLEVPFEIENGRKNKTVNVIGLEENTVFYGFKDTDGGEVKVPRDGILLSSNLASNLDAKIGDLILLNSFVNDDEIYVKVKGIINQTLGINGYMNIDYLREKFLDKGVINGVYINSEDDVKNKLDDMKNINVQSQRDVRVAFEEFTTVTNMSMGFMVIFSGLLGFVIMYSMTLMSINERTIEFSSLRVMGFTKGEIFKMLMRENMIMTVIGIFAGIPMGFWLVDYMGKTFTTDIYTMNEPLLPINIILSVVLTFFFIVLAQLMTYVKIHKLDFMQSLKNRIS